VSIFVKIGCVLDSREKKSLKMNKIWYQVNYKLSPSRKPLARIIKYLQATMNVHQSLMVNSTKQRKEDSQTIS